MAEGGSPGISVLSDGVSTFKLLAKFEMARFRAYRHCNIQHVSDEPSPARTRKTEPKYTVRLISTCTQCNDRHVEIGQKSYLVHFCTLPFECEHGNTIESLEVDDPEERTLPIINLPSNIKRVANPNASVSSGGVVTIDKLEADLRRIQDTFKEADQSFTNLTTLIRAINFDTSRYPQYKPDNLG